MLRKALRLLIFLTICFIFTSASAAEKTADRDRYKIGPGDVVDISVWKDTSLSREIMVPPDGIIAFPLIGNIDTSGQTVESLRKSITKKISVYIPDATVTVLLKQFGSLKAYVIGNVNRSGIYPITMETSVMQILAMAGGLTPFASESKIHVLRKTKDKTIKIPFNYKEVVKGKRLNQNIFLQRSDVIVVP